jgi:ElaB/YqjD/DUF883 family membrane-anchored ribosome-binding protein
MELRAKDARTAARQAQQAIKDATQEWTEKVKTAGQSAMDKISGAYDVAHEKTVAGARVTDRAIRDNPYAALGIAFGCGLLIGLLVKPRR